MIRIELAVRFPKTVEGVVALRRVCHLRRCGGVPSGAGDALFLTHSGTALKGVLLGIVFGSSTFIVAFFDWSQTNVPLALRFSKKDRVCDAHKNNCELGTETDIETTKGSGGEARSKT